MLIGVFFDALPSPQQKHDHNDNQPDGQSAEKERKHRQHCEDEEYLNK
jgi:hypothetical protein